MEEILASIRRIISEDEAPPESPEPAPPAPEPVAAAPEPEPEPVMAQFEEEEEDDVLELTQRVEPPAESHGDLDVYAAPEPKAPEPEPVPAPAFSQREEEGLVGASAAGLAASAFGQLAQTISMPADSRTLEDVVRELLKPLLKAWLDEHLPGIVQAKVEAEVERIARGRVR